MRPDWRGATLQFLRDMQDPGTGGARSVPDGPATLYGTCYAALCATYLGADDELPERTRRFITGCQDPETGLMIGPELRTFQPPPTAIHDRDHLVFHLTCAALPACRQFGLTLPDPVRAAHRFADPAYLHDWLDRRDLRRAWLEGNNLLFVGQLLVYLRDAEGLASAPLALESWFRWLETHVDPQTSLWGTNGDCSAMEATYGGYHQLLVYYHEQHPIANPEGLVDTVLGLQHDDGGFHPGGDGGACEDVDCVDILVNLYKQHAYRRPEIRAALRQCLRHILVLQNHDGGFPYNRRHRQTHMGIPGTAAAAGRSTMFATWFRTHTLALIAEILTDEPALSGPFGFTNNLSMGWHRPWDRRQHVLTQEDRTAEAPFARRWRWRRARLQALRCGAPLRVTISLARALGRRVRNRARGR
jgi:hypothetical protein